MMIVVKPFIPLDRDWLLQIDGRLGKVVHVLVKPDRAQAKGVQS